MVEFVLGFGIAALVCSAATEGRAPLDYAIDAMPEGYFLQAYDDCGVPDRQPHIVKAPDTTTYCFSTNDVSADERARTVATNPKQIDAVYEKLNPDLEYVVAVTYSSEPFNSRVQSLWANEIELHGPRPLPKGKAERLLFRIPREGGVTPEGLLTLHLRLEGPVNAVVSALELWAPAKSPKVLHLSGVGGLNGDIEGKVLGLSYEAVASVKVALRRASGGQTIATVETGADGGFAFRRDLFDDDKRRAPLEVIAQHDGANASYTLAVDDLYFDPVRYRPIPEQVGGLEELRVSLDGVWRLNVAPGMDAPGQPLDAPGWSDCRVPGQWRQQGYDVPLDQHVAMARAFAIPAAWTGYRIFLRFEAIHGGTNYYLNGGKLGYSENLFTPVEWEITDFVHAGATNRIDLDMVVDTVSEKLSYSCGYAFHNLGGIDRSVFVYALPSEHLRELAITSGLDNRCEDGVLHVIATADDPESKAAEGLELRTELRAPDGSRIELAGAATLRIGAEAGRPSFVLDAKVARPLTWNAEQPRLYVLALELKRGDIVLERIERSIGFRKIEVRSSQLYVNGQRVKLAGACHHEIDPLTGRADTARHAEEDVRLLKQANMNYLRTSHYPPTQELLDAADRLGMYVEVEAPFCWVAPSSDLSSLRQVLTPTSAMIDYCRRHPSVIVWSLANESSFNRCFEIANALCKQLDPSRPTTFNNPDPKRICDIANVHYPPMPYDEQLKGDPRPIFLGEYFFPVCHEQTDVMIDPGLRELWGQGHSAPDSAWGQYCTESFALPYTHPGAPPGAWTHIVDSDRVIGGAIWAALDEPFYLPDGQKAGYAWHHGFWGLIDAWRRPKPEAYLAKLIFSPVWFPSREVEYATGQTTLHVSVENRYSFTNLNELTLTCLSESGTRAGAIAACDVPPGGKGELAVTLDAPVNAGDKLCIRADTAKGERVSDNWIFLGKRIDTPLPQPEAGPPKRAKSENKDIIGTGDLSLVLDRARGDFDAADTRHTAAVVAFPSIHVTRFDFGDLAPELPYAVFPDPATRTIESVHIENDRDAIVIEVQDRYAGFAGWTRWTLDAKGIGRVAYDYVYSGKKLNAREIGVRFLLKPECDTLAWRRWSEWGDFPAEALCRATGTARARRDPALGAGSENEKPAWPWIWDQTALGTNDFRSVKFNIYEARLAAPDGSGVSVYANADAHVRACLDPKGVWMHVLKECRLGPYAVNDGDHIQGEFTVSLSPAQRP